MAVFLYGLQTYFGTISIVEIWLQLQKLAFGEYRSSSIIKCVYVYLYVKSSIEQFLKIVLNFK